LTPQAPQLFGSEVLSMHEPAQATRGLVQAVAVHVPWLHTWPEVQALPQVPQFAGSFNRSMHTLLHIS
jgi:hypothetical protein